MRLYTGNEARAIRRTLQGPEAAPIWPLYGRKPKMPTPGGSFGAPRGRKKGRQKLHAGADLGAPEGTPVLAMDAGRVVWAWNGWDNIDAKGNDTGNTAMLIVQNYDGRVVNYAAVGKDSWLEFGINKGSEVYRGEPIARVGRYPGGGTMLHLETYAKGTRRNIKWWEDEGKPDALLDPMPYVSASIDNVAPPRPMPPAPQPTPRPMPGPSPSPSPSPAPAQAGGGGLLVLVLLGFVFAASGGGHG